MVSTLAVKDENIYQNTTKPQPYMRRRQCTSLWQEAKSCLIGELCLHYIVHFGYVTIYISHFQHKQCVSHWKDITFVKFTPLPPPSQIFSSTGELSTKRICYYWVSLLQTLYMFHVHPYNICGEASSHLMARNWVSKSFLMPGLCFHHLVHFACVLIYIFGFHHKKVAGHWRFAFVKFNSQMFSSIDKSSKAKMHLLLLSWVASKTANFCCQQWAGAYFSGKKQFQKAA